MSDPDVHLRKFQKELSTGTVSLALLAVLARAPEQMYGYLIAKELERVGDGVLSGKQSALYPVLRNLEGAGLLESHVEPSVAGPPRRNSRMEGVRVFFGRRERGEGPGGYNDCGVRAPVLRHAPGASYVRSARHIFGRPSCCCPR